MGERIHDTAFKRARKRTRNYCYIIQLAALVSLEGISTYSPRRCEVGIISCVSPGAGARNKQEYVLDP